ncbi:hypothetical protein INN71_17675 [Nocardioides sp. ChNu-153]|uniref:hypothetical protein n=1 Tax=unclassified Nocardioides TaxID=2615069 RepID=UPI0024058F8F|nr:MULTISPECIES: hypothetical protein [unclassified Nocardioides]MDF9717761.1 hypothetical protein [Nocardioides sp. ChNu-99]MDN7123214.1 hypothetical protein [Nocardioides sp. ChNu-153]
METIDIVLSPFARRARSVVLAHGATRLTRGLEPGETVVLRDEQGELHTAHVADLDFDLEETYYRLALDGPATGPGSPASAPAEPGSDDDLARVEELLRRAREEGLAPPARRPSPGPMAAAR